MQAVDEVVCLVEFSTQLGLLAVMKGATANRPGRTTGSADSILRDICATCS